MPETTNPQTPAARIRAYLDALPAAVNVGAEFAYGRQFRSEEWPHDSYPLTRDDVEALLAELARAQAEAHQYRTALQGAARKAAAPASPSAPADRAALSARLWAVAEHHIVAEWICCEPINPQHELCVQGDATLRMVKALLVDDPEAIRPAPLLDAVLAVLPEPADRSAILRGAADRLWALANRTTERGAGVLWAADRLRCWADEPADGPSRVAGEAPQPETQGDAEPVPCVRPEAHPAHLHSGLRKGVAVHGRCPGEAQQPKTCGRTWSVSGNEYPPCARPAGHREAYCRSADGQSHFLGVDDEPAAVSRPGKEA